MERNVNIQESVGTDAIVVSVEKGNMNGRRASIICINTSTGGEKITLGIDTSAIVNKGIVLAPGGVWADSMDAGYMPTQKQITAISDGAGGLLSIQERVID